MHSAIQNNLGELFTLLALLDPLKFPSREEFNAKYEQSDPQHWNAQCLEQRQYFLNRIAHTIMCAVCLKFANHGLCQRCDGSAHRAAAVHVPTHEGRCREVSAAKRRDAHRSGDDHPAEAVSTHHTRGQAQKRIPIDTRAHSLGSLAVFLACRYYRAVFEKNIEFLAGKGDKKSQSNLMNVAMQLRKGESTNAPQTSLMRQAGKGISSLSCALVAFFVVFS